jgi:saccharopine dehydrogenase-like NADP-dependent oxidoreductase
VAAATVHFLNCASGKIPTFRDGKVVYISPLEQGEEVTYPNGRATFYHIGHAEPVTLPLYIKGVKHACNLFGGWPEVLEVLRDLGQKVTNGVITAFQAGEMFAGQLARRFREKPGLAGQEILPMVGGLLGSAEGLKIDRTGQKRMRYSYCLNGAPPGGMAGVTGVPLAIAAEMLLAKEIKSKGVVGPEACIDPIPFFDRYSKHWAEAPDGYWAQALNKGRILAEVIEELD